MKIKNQRFLGVMIIAFFILFFALSLMFIHLQNLQYQSSVELHQGNFPDKTFRSYIMVSFDDGDKKLSNKELKKITSIDISDQIEITSVKGIEHFSNLKTLYCDRTKIQELDISENEALQKLCCGETPLRTLDLSKNKALKILDCNNTKIKTLDVTQNTQLTYLNCYRTRIQELDLSQNPRLKILNCSNTRLNKLNVNQNPELEYLYCDNNKIQELDVKQNSKLIYLNCRNNPLVYFNIGTKENLTNLYYPNPSMIEINITGDVFSIKEEFTSMIVEKIHIIDSTATINEDGTIRNFQKGVPIHYTYECGRASQGTIILQVKLNIVAA